MYNDVSKHHTIQLAQIEMAYHSVTKPGREGDRKQTLRLRGLPRLIHKDVSEVAHAEVESMEPTGCHARCHDDAML